MEQVQFNHSLKDIPIPSNQEYLLELINSVGVFISNLRWRCHFFLNPSNANPKETFGFKTSEPAPPVDELKVFEDEIHDLVKSVTFRPQANTPLRSTMKENIRKMKTDPNIYVAAKKTANYYKIRT